MLSLSGGGTYLKQHDPNTLKEQIFVKNDHDDLNRVGGYQLVTLDLRSRRPAGRPAGARTPLARCDGCFCMFYILLPNWIVAGRDRSLARSGRRRTEVSTDEKENIAHEAEGHGLITGIPGGQRRGRPSARYCSRKRRAESGGDAAAAAASHWLSGGGGGGRRTRTPIRMQR